MLNANSQYLRRKHLGLMKLTVLVFDNFFMFIFHRVLFQSLLKYYHIYIFLFFMEEKLIPCLQWYTAASTSSLRFVYDNQNISRH